MGGGGKNIIKSKKSYREKGATRDKKVFVGIEPSTVDDALRETPKLYKHLSDGWVNHPDIALDESLEWSEFKSALREYEFVAIITQSQVLGSNSYSLKFYRSFRGRQFGSISESDVQASVIALAVCDHEYHYKGASRLASSTTKVIDCSVEMPGQPHLTHGPKSMIKINDAINSYLQ